MLATGVTVGQAQGIIDDSFLVFLVSFLGMQFMEAFTNICCFWDVDSTCFHITDAWVSTTAGYKAKATPPPYTSIPC